MSKYQFFLQPFGGKWSNEAIAAEECKNRTIAHDKAFNLAIQHGANVRYQVVGNRKLHYYRPSEGQKRRIIARLEKEKAARETILVVTRPD